MALRSIADRRSLGLALAAVAGLCVAAGHARAQSGSAAALFNEGYRLLDEGKLVEACEAFEASNRAQPGAGTYLALGTCRERNHQLASAWSAYQAALDRARDVEKRNYARARIAELEPRLSLLTVSVPAGHAAGLTVTRNGASIDALLWNRALPTDGGDYLIEARAPGRAPWRTTLHVPNSGGKITAVVPELAPTEPGSPPPPPLPPTGWTARRKLALGAAGASVVVAAVGVALGVSARNEDRRAHELCPMPEDFGCTAFDDANAHGRSAHNLGIAADVAFGVAGAAAIAAGVLWFTGERDARGGVAIAPAASPGGFAVTAAVQF